jgi:Predicted membrane protein (DUF2232)
MQRSIWVTVGAGFASAILFLTVVISPSAIGLVLNMVASLPVFMAGLAFGARGAAIAGLVGMVVVLLGSAMVGTDGSWELALSFFAWQCVAPTVLVRQALLSRKAPDGEIEWFPAGHLLLWLTGLAALGAVFVTFTYTAGDGGFSGALEREILGQGGNALPPGSTPETEATVRQALGLLVRILPGVAAASFMVTMIANAALAQGLLKRSGQALRPSPAYTEVELPPGWGGILALGLAMALAIATSQTGTAEVIGLTAAILLATPFLLIGLAVVHTLARRWPARVLLLGTFYFLAVATVWLWLLVAILGLVENWVGLRRRIAASRPSRGEK